MVFFEYDPLAMVLSVLSTSCVLGIASLIGKPDTVQGVLFSRVVLWFLDACPD